MKNHHHFVYFLFLIVLATIIGMGPYLLEYTGFSVYCGDNVCEAGENIVSCSMDCNRIIGFAKDIQTVNIKQNELDLLIDGDSEFEEPVRGNLRVKILEEKETLLMFNFNFDKDILNLKEISLERKDDELYVSGLDVDFVAYVENKLRLGYVCVDNNETVKIYEAENCKNKVMCDNEYCNDLGFKYKVLIEREKEVKVEQPIALKDLAYFQKRNRGIILIWIAVGILLFAAVIEFLSGSKLIEKKRRKYKF